MKVLLAHNHYGASAPSGEDAVFLAEWRMLERHGIEVIPYERHNDQADAASLGGRLAIAGQIAWSRRSHAELSRLIAQTRPDVAHFHNTFPLISPSAYAACQEQGVAVVQTLHNFRLICPGGLLLREGWPCEDCVGASLAPALRHRCYRGSLAATGAVAWMLARNRLAGTYRHRVNRYVALTEFAAERLSRGGLPRERIAVKPNFLADAPTPGRGGGGYAVFVGRLGEEKGLDVLLAAWRGLTDIPLRLVGDGPQRARLQALAHQSGAAVQFLGMRSHAETLELIAAAELLVLPSRCYEGFPLVLLEAYACGTPVVVPRLGGMDEIVVHGVTGLKYAPGDVADLAATVRGLWAERTLRRSLGEGARAEFEAKYTEQANLAHLLEIYRQARWDFAHAGREYGTANCDA